MCSATAWTGSMITLLFVSLTTNSFKLLWQQLQRSCLRNRWIVSVLVSAERQRRGPAGSHRQGISGHDWTRTDTRASLSWTQRAAGPITSEADEALVSYGRISQRPLPTWWQRFLRIAGNKTVRSWCQKQGIATLQATGNESLDWRLAGIVRQTPDHKPQLSQLVVCLIMLSCHYCRNSIASLPLPVSFLVITVTQLAFSIPLR